LLRNSHIALQQLKNLNFLTLNFNNNWFLIDGANKINKLWQNIDLVTEIEISLRANGITKGTFETIHRTILEKM
jgi:hypothetical protein